MTTLNLSQAPLFSKKLNTFLGFIIWKTKGRTQITIRYQICGIVIISAICMLLTSGKLSAQPMNMEGMPGNKYFFYQHSLSRQLGEKSRFNVKHIASVIARYNTNAESGGKANEIMNQAYLGFRLFKNLSFHAGGFYTDATNLRASAAIQFNLQRKDLLVVIIPRTDIMKQGAFDIFTLLEYKPVVADQVKLYLRIQTMSNFGPDHHNRGYQQFRLGLNAKSTQFGLGLNLDEYGEKLKMYSNWGIFIKKEIY